MTTVTWSASIFFVNDANSKCHKSMWSGLIPVVQFPQKHILILSLDKDSVSYILQPSDHLVSHDYGLYGTRNDIFFLQHLLFMASYYKHSFHPCEASARPAQALPHPLVILLPCGARSVGDSARYCTSSDGVDCWGNRWIVNGEM